ncbi:hypothetical protein BN7_6172 [Wickerhamomyces ciferrii]|uniref:PPPDE domain-containing protein n=1 Tax=Wickerhamomyces ciferrii (strain ATCC 14091 / BCRC 22168 / CBS 111 / JCM 3599 / NBRC 0793 / NRRL Y-1031 F-60-10) TaxID=1206466 RepID=K0KYV0_WICCF|nr:uncharacterized protein BN7_6172 [Wickerhamomyces ciferrii]CCH46579.1 hypothetical protein BN7_6172 [Wickerhamomyces ciferrii]
MTHQIKLNIYDLSQGLASQFSPMILGFHIKAIYHTSITIFNQEWYFNSQGIQRSIPYQTHFGKPIEIRDMGTTEIPLEIFEEFIQDLPRFQSGKYELWENNCNDFTKTVMEFLNDFNDFDDEIYGLSRRVLNSEKGEMLRQLMTGMIVD